MGALSGFVALICTVCVLPFVLVAVFHVAESLLHIPPKHLLIVEIGFVCLVHAIQYFDSYELRFELLVGLLTHLSYASNIIVSNFPVIEFYSLRALTSLMCLCCHTWSGSDI